MLQLMKMMRMLMMMMGLSLWLAFFYFCLWLTNSYFPFAYPLCIVDMLSQLWIPYFGYLDVGFQLSILPTVRLPGFLHCYFELISPLTLLLVMCCLDLYLIFLLMWLILFDNAKGGEISWWGFRYSFRGSIKIMFSIQVYVSMYVYFEGECT